MRLGRREPPSGGQPLECEGVAEQGPTRSVGMTKRLLRPRRDENRPHVGGTPPGGPRPVPVHRLARRLAQARSFPRSSSECGTWASPTRFSGLRLGSAHARGRRVHRRHWRGQPRGDATVRRPRLLGTFGRSRLGHEMTRRAVVTGGAGFIGSHVADELARAGWSVLVLDDLSTGRAENVAESIELEALDIVDEARLFRAFSSFEPDVVFHLAAQSSVTVSVRDPDRDFAVNVRGTFNVCEAARRARASVVFASTGGALYGDAAPVPTPETVPPEPLAPYGASKLAGEAYVATWGRFHDLGNVVLRLGNVYGPRQNASGEAGVVAIFSDRLARGLSPVVYGDGLQTRDYVHVSDVARAFLLAADAQRPATLNVAQGSEVTVLQVLKELQIAATTATPPKFGPLRRGELKRSALDPAAIRATLGWHAQIGLEEGLRETYAWYTAQRASETATRR